MKPTASLRMKDRELCRIVDDEIRFTEKVEVLKYHYAKSRADKQKLGLEEFINKQKQKMLEENAKRLFLNQKKNKASEPLQNEPKYIELKNLEGNKKKNKEDPTSLDSYVLTETLNNLALGLLTREDAKQFANYMPSLEKNELLFIHVMQHTHEYPPNFVLKLVQTLNKNSSEIKDTLVNSYNDYKSFITLMIQFLRNIEVNTNIYEEFMSFLENVGRELVEEQSDICSLYMESIGLELITKTAQQSQGKRDGLAHLIVCFTPQTFNERCRILEKLSDYFKGDLKNLSSILAHLSEYPVEGGMDTTLFNHYWFKAIKINEYSYPSMKTNGLKILSEISKFNVSQVHLYLPQIHRLSDEHWWEIKAQILILCANQLEYLQNNPNASLENQQNTINERQLKNNSYSQYGSQDLDDDDESQQSNSQYHRRELNRDSNISNSQLNHSKESHKNLDHQESMNQAKESYISGLITIIQKIFHMYQNVNVLKVGLIYLAKTLDYYPELCERYLQVLLTINDEIKKSILNTDPNSQRKNST